jgi:hypothetical protein
MQRVGKRRACGVSLYRGIYPLVGKVVIFGVVYSMVWMDLTSPGYFFSQ